MSPSSTLFLVLSIISIWNSVECGGGRGAPIGEEDTVDESPGRSIVVEDLPSVIELLDESGNDYEYKTVVPDAVIVPIHFDSSLSKRGGGRVFTDVIEKRDREGLFPEKREATRLFKRGGGRPSVIEPEDDYSM